MDTPPIVVLPLDGEDSIDPPLIRRRLTETVPVEILPQLMFLPKTPVSELYQSLAEAPRGIIFYGMAHAKRPTELGRLTDLDLWNPREYKHDLLRPWQRALTKAKKQGEIPAHARALFLHHEADLSAEQLTTTLMPLVRRIGLWTRFWNNHESSKASAS